MKKIIETERLYLREMTAADFGSLCTMLCDKDVMYAYEHAFDEAEAREWLDRQLERYEKYGFGLWAVILKENGEMIGQCGITMQDIGGKKVEEVGYLFAKVYWHMGYAIEAAKACKEYAFKKLGINRVYSIIRDNNTPSRKVAERNGMTPEGKLIKHYYNMDMPHIIYSVGKE